MPDISIRISNLPQIKRAFGMAPSLMRRNLNLAIRKSILMVERDSRILTPVDTGRLRASHRSVFRDLYGEVGTHTLYDVFVHSGTSRMKARPYLANAVKSQQMNIDRNFRDAVQSTLDSIGKMT